MLQRVDWSLIALVSLSLFLLIGVIYFWWMGEASSPLPPEVKEEESSLSVLQMEGAEISRVGEKGQEWVLNALSLEQKGDRVFLNDVSGTFFQGGAPLYQVKAQKGQLILSGGDVELDKVKLVNEEKKETLQGELLVWRGNEENFELQKARFSGEGIEANCQLIVYNLSEKKLWLKDDVELRVQVGK